MVEAALGESFERPKKFDLEKYWEETTSLFFSQLPSFPVRMRIKKEQLEKFGSVSYNKILEYSFINEEWMDARIDLETKDWARCQILGFGDSVFVLEPKELQDEIVETAEKIRKLYITS
ncbi:helix-turn-helix transcriptional regulator [Leptospira ellisii]|uniref:helix-turn-helix transcriptional regulator n=1 Tax=Leptospira ellisii TaxID=2023197 RepID=UPI001FAF5939|nr:WYL domain-containing protein [Leptospira ellisii]